MIFVSVHEEEARSCTDRAEHCAVIGGWILQLKLDSEFCCPSNTRIVAILGGSLDKHNYPLQDDDCRPAAVGFRRTSQEQEPPEEASRNNLDSRRQLQFDWRVSMARCACE